MHMQLIMMHASRDAEANDRMVDQLEHSGTLRSPACIAAFRAVDRGDFWIRRGSFGSDIYGDAPLRHGKLHQSAPHIYARALEALMPLKPGMSFLNIGSGTGYFSCLVAEVVGECGVNDGLELWPENVVHAQERCASLGKYHIEFNVGNVYQLDVNLGMRYDRIYIGACACPRAQYLYSLLEVGGVLVGPFQSGHSQQLRRVVRESEAHFKIEVLNSVHFASLVEPPATQELSDDAPAPLGVLPVVGLPGVPFAFALRQKPWSVERNWAYPRSFRQVAAVLMQNQASLGLVPLELWVEHILPWCPRWWFDVPGKRRSRSGTLAMLAAASRSMSKAFFSSSTCSTRSGSSIGEAEGSFSGDEVNIVTNDEVPLVQPPRRRRSLCRAAQRAMRRCLRCLSRLGNSASNPSELVTPLSHSHSVLPRPGPFRSTGCKAGTSNVALALSHHEPGLALPHRRFLHRHVCAAFVR
ncbi:PCMTD1 [Symbiodinium sp. CCMP2592]|nr:PCMTD1 [Symbiodinium sp. CCMP2592]